MKKILLFIAVMTFGFTVTNAQSFEIRPDAGYLTGNNPDLDLTGSDEPQIRGRRVRGTLTLPAALSLGTGLLELTAAGHNGTSFTGDRVGIQFAAAQNWTSTANGTSIGFFTTQNFSTSQQERMRLSNHGNLGIGVINPGAKLHVDGGIKLNVNSNTTDFISFDVINTSTLPGMRFLTPAGALIGGHGHGNVSTQLWRGIDSNAGLSLNDNNYLGLNNFNPTVPFHINYTNTTTNSSNGAMVVGEFAGQHLNFDKNEINAWNGTAGSRLYLNFWSQATVQVGNAPIGVSLDVKGYTTLGNGAPNIKMKKLTGTTNVTAGAVTSIPHGIGDSDKILSVDIAIKATGSTFVPENYTQSPNLEFNYYYNDTNIDIVTKTGNSAFLLSSAIKIIITYEE
jgi:hypothetical protein